MASLASMIMEGTIFNDNDSPIDISNYDYSKKILFETSFTNNAVATLFSDIMEAEKIFLASDVISSAQALHAQKVNEAYDLKAVTEGAFGDFISRIIESIKKFWAKIVEWFKKAFDWIKMWFLNAKDFVKKYKNVLRNKKATGFKHTGYEWKLTDTDSMVDTWAKAFQDNAFDLCGKLEDIVISKSNNNNYSYDSGASLSDEEKKKLVSGGDIGDTGKRKLSSDSSLEFIKRSINQTFAASAKFEENESNSSSDVIDRVVKSVTGGKADEQSDLSTYLFEQYRGDASEKSTINDLECGQFKGPSAILTFLETGDKKISDFERNRKDMEKAVDRLIKSLNKIKTTSDEDKNNLSGAISYATSLASGMLSCMKTCFDAKIKAWKDAMSELLTVMKHFVSFKPLGESTEYIDATLGYSVFEASGDKKSDDADSDDSSSDKKSDDEDSVKESVASILEMAHSFAF